MQVLNEMDRDLLLWIQENLRTKELTERMKKITHLGDKGWLWVTITWVLYMCKKTRRIGVCMAASLMLAAFVTNLIVKPYVARSRPYDSVRGLERLIPLQYDWSFPSGHTSASFAAAGIIYFMACKKWGTVALLLASAISYSRMYLGVHYLSDVLAGVAVGLGSAMIVDEINERIK
ncbi:MAG: phosphatase PAP2 family protein [Eubacteriales bacterium]